MQAISNVIFSLVSTSFFRGVRGKSAVETASHFFVLLILYEMARAILFVYLKSPELTSLSVKSCTSQFTTAFPADFEVLYDADHESFEIPKDITIQLPDCLSAGISLSFEWFSHDSVRSTDVWNVFDPHILFKTKYSETDFTNSLESGDGEEEGDEAGSIEDQPVSMVLVHPHGAELAGFIPVSPDWIAETFCEPVSTSITGKLPRNSSGRSSCNRHSISSWATKLSKTWSSTWILHSAGSLAVTSLTLFLGMLELFDILLVSFMVFVCNIIIRRVLWRRYDPNQPRSWWYTFKFCIFTSSRVYLSSLVVPLLPETDNVAYMELAFHVCVTVYLMHKVALRAANAVPSTRSASGTTAAVGSGARAPVDSFAQVLSGNPQQVLGLLAGQQTWSAYYKYCSDLTVAMKAAMESRSGSTRARTSNTILQLVARVLKEGGIKAGDVKIVHIWSCLNKESALQECSDQKRLDGGPGFVYGQAKSTGTWLFLGWYPALFSNQALELLRDYPGDVYLSPKAVPDLLIPNTEQLQQMRQQVDEMKQLLARTAMVGLQ